MSPPPKAIAFVGTRLLLRNGGEGLRLPTLMVGFVADGLEGEIRIDGEEIEDTRWFGPDELPVLPHPMSIARALIEDFVRRVS